MSDKVRADTPEQAEFRTYCKEWLSKNRPYDRVLTLRC